jgi:hypothetical protein
MPPCSVWNRTSGHRFADAYAIHGDYDAEVAAALPQVLQKDRLGILERKVDQILARLPLAEPKHWKRHFSCCEQSV